MYYYRCIGRGYVFSFIFSLVQWLLNLFNSKIP